MGIDARNLCRHVSTNTHRPAGQLINQLKRPQVHVLPSPGQQGLKVFKHGRHHQLIAIKLELIEYRSPQLFYLARFRRQDVGNIFREKPIRHMQRVLQFLK
jgi:hypothetical protein